MNKTDFIQYTGTKTIKAVPMTKGEAEKHLDRKIDTSAVENKEDQPGYLVEYEDGYQSWSPKDVFEKAYKPSETYVDRMRIEHAEYLDRLHKLSNFTCSPAYRQLPAEEKSRQATQLKLFYELLQILGERIDFAEKQLLG